MSYWSFCVQGNLKSALNGHRFHLKTFDFLALPTRPTLPPFSARPAWSNSSAGLQQQQDGKALQYCSAELQKDLKISTIAAVRQNGQALKNVPEEMKGDRDVCKAAVAQNGLALQWASEEMKGDRELCMAAVAQDGKALEWASEEMKGDRALCMAAVAQNGLALEHASDDMKNDRSIVMVAVQANNSWGHGSQWDGSGPHWGGDEG